MNQLSVRIYQLTTASLLFFVLACNSHAHTPFIAPASFEPVRDGMVTLDASFGETFFIPEVAFDNDDFAIIGPDRKSTQPDVIVPMKTRTVIEHKLPAEGTYRITTGARYGAEFYIYDLNGEEKRARDPKEPLPQGAIVKSHFQAITRADTYITYDQLNDAAVSVEKRGLQIQPLTHPNELFAMEDFHLQVLFDGEPLAKTSMTIYRVGAEKTEEPLEAMSDDNGVVTLALGAGKYLFRVRHRAAAPESAKVPTYSHTTTLSVLVYDNL